MPQDVTQCGTRCTASLASSTLAANLAHGWHLTNSLYVCSNCKLTSTLMHALAQDVANAGEVYSRLANSIAPEIFGHEDVKKVCTCTA
jgi:hypothetical protein